MPSNSAGSNLNEHEISREVAKPHELLQEARQRRADGATLQELATSYNVSRATISRLRTA